MKSGFFQITKEVAITQQNFEEDNIENLQQLLKIKTNNKRQKMATRTEIKKETIEIANLGRGSVIGKEDALREGRY